MKPVYGIGQFQCSICKNILRHFRSIAIHIKEVHRMDGAFLTHCSDCKYEFRSYFKNAT